MKNFSLKSRVFLPHASVLFVLLAVLYFFFFLKTKELERDSQERFLNEFFLLIKSDLSSQNENTLIKNIKERKSLFNLSFISNKKYLEQQKAAQTRKNLFYLFDDKKASLFSRILTKNLEKKFVRISHKNNKKTAQALNNLLFLTFSVGLVSLILFFLIMSLFSQSLRKTLREISEITRSIDLEDYDKKIIKIPQNTFGNLGQEFNHLVKRVRSHLKRRRHIEKIRREFTSNVSHELKTPLTSIKGYTETLIAGAIHDGQNNMRFLKIIDQNIDRLIQLVKDLLELSHIESSERFMKLVPVSWRAILSECFSRWEVEMQKKNINFTFDYPENLPKVLGNERAMSHIIDNLVQNAFYYNYKNGSVHIGFEEDDHSISIIVRDTGIGISEKDQKRIFERFFRVDSSRTSSSEHSGIGLAIVKHLVMQLQGTITLKSKLEEGSEFKVTLKKEALL